MWGCLVKPLASRGAPWQVLMGRLLLSGPALGCAHMPGLRDLPLHLENFSKGGASAGPQ